MDRAAFLVSSPRSAALRAINYASELEHFRRSKKGVFTTAPLGTLLSSCGESYWSVFTRLDCDRDHGVELITQGDMFAVEPEGRTIRKDSMPQPDAHEVKRWQVLIAGAGQMAEGNLFGRSIIADARLAGRFLGPHAVALTFGEPGSDTNLWTYAFLNTELGHRLVKACAFGTSVPGIRLDLLREIPIPIPADPAVLSRVAGAVRTCVHQREAFVQRVQVARGIIDNLPEMHEARDMCLHARRKTILWSGELRTLRAWNYVSAGEANSHLGRAWGGRVGDAVEKNGIFGGERFPRVPCERPYGVPLFSQRDVFSIHPLPRRIRRPAGLELDVDDSTLLIASRGQMNQGTLFGRIERGAHMERNVIVTGDCMRMLPRAGLSEGLYAYLSTSVGRALLRSTAYGTSIPAMRTDLITALPIPEFRALAECVPEVRLAAAARVAASTAEAEANRTIEEELLPLWLV